MMALAPFGAWAMRVAEEGEDVPPRKPRELSTDWPAAWPPAEGDQTEGPWPRRSSLSYTKVVESLTDENKRYSAPLFAQYPLMGSVTIPAGPMEGTHVPFPHSIQDAEGLGYLGTADASKVEAIMPKPWRPVLTVDGRATWGTWKDVERVNYLGQVCQRQWVAFYAQHPDHSFPPVESPFQLLFGQFAGYHYFSYTHQMYTDCETMVEIDRNMYGWDSHLSEHSYNRDIHGNLVWNVTSGGEKIMDAKVYMPYGPSQLIKYIRDLRHYGVAGPPLGQDPDQLWRFLKGRTQQFMWLSKPGVMPIKDSENLTPVIHSPFGQFDTPNYPSTEAGDQWESTLNHFADAYYDDNGPFAIKTPFDEEDSITWFGEFAELDMQIPREFSLAFYTHHFRMLWNSPWTFTRVEDYAGPN